MRQLVGSWWTGWWTGVRRFGALGLIIPLLLVTTVMGRLDAVLADMHLAGGSAGGVTSIASPLTSARAAEEIRAAWADWDLERRAQEQQQTLGDEDASGGPRPQGGADARVAGAAQPVPPGTIATWWLLLDSFFLAPLLGLVLILLNRSRCRALGGTDTDDEAPDSDVRRAVRAVLDVSVGLVGLYVIFDLLENLVTFASVTGDLMAGVDLIWLVRPLSALKLVFFALALLPILVSFVWASADPLRRVWRTLVVVRAQAVGAILVFVFLVMVGSDVGNQLADVARALGDRPVEAVTAVVLFAGLSLFVWVSGTRLLVAHVESGPVLRSSGDAPLALKIEAAGPAPETDADSGVLARIRAVLARYRLPLIVTVAFLVLALLLTNVVWAVAVLPLALVVVHALLSGAVTEVWSLPGRRPPLEDPSWSLLGLLAFLPVFALALLWIRAETGVAEWLGVTGLVALLTILALGVVWGLLGHLVDQRVTGAVAGPQWASWRLGTVTLLVAVTALLTLWAVLKPLAAGHALGALAYVGVLVLLITIGLTTAVVLLDHRPPRGAFAALRLRHFPVLTVTLLLLVLAATVNTVPSFHRARLLDEDTATRSGVPRIPERLDAAFRNWLAESEGDSAGYEPLFIVAASGGASRSAYWTMISLECLFGGEVEQPNAGGEGDVLLPACSGPATGGFSQVMLASGISGGSVGLTMFATDRWDRGDPVAGEPDFDEEAPFRGPSLAPAAAGLATTDLLNSFTQVTEVDLPFTDLLHLDDRAAVLEQEWQDHLPEMEDGFFATQLDGEHGHFPRLMLNSASVEDGCIFNTSVLDLSAGDVVDPDEQAGFLAQCRSLARFEQATRELEVDDRRMAPLPGARDLADYLCQEEDLRLSTAALLSARFPYVSPTGALQRCGGAEDPPFTFLVDGGYVDSSAASQTAAVLDELVDLVQAENLRRRDSGDPCIQPVVLQLDNGYEDEAGDAGSGRPMETLAPPSGRATVNSGRAQAGRQMLAEHATTLLRGETINCEAAEPDLPRYIRVYPRSHPGLQAPMGWQLSEEARADMRAQLGGSGNQCSLLAARAWLDGGLAEMSTVRALSCVQGLVQEEPDDVGAPGAELRFCVDAETPAGDCSRTVTDPYGAFSALVEAGEDQVRIDLDGDGTVDHTQDLVCEEAAVCSRRIRVSA